MNVIHNRTRSHRTVKHRDVCSFNVDNGSVLNGGQLVRLPGIGERGQFTIEITLAELIRLIMKTPLSVWTRAKLTPENVGTTFATLRILQEYYESFQPGGASVEAGDSDRAQAAYTAHRRCIRNVEKGRP